MENLAPRFNGIGRGRGLIIQRSDPRPSAEIQTIDLEEEHPRSAGAAVELGSADSSSFKLNRADATEDISALADDTKIPQAVNTNADVKEVSIEAEDKDTNANAVVENIVDAVVESIANAGDTSTHDAVADSIANAGDTATDASAVEAEVIVIDIDAEVSTATATTADNGEARANLATDTADADKALRSGTSVSGLSKQESPASPQRGIEKPMNDDPGQAAAAPMEIAEHINGESSEITTAVKVEVTGEDVVTSKRSCLEESTTELPKTILSAVDNPIPMLKFLPRVAVKDDRPSAPKVLAEYASVYDGIDIQYSCNVVKAKFEDGPITYKVIVKAGFRGGEGVGATISEAKALAAEDCLKELKAFTNDSEVMEHKPVVRTDPHKDILYVLEGICRDYGFKKPAYSLVQSGTTTEGGLFQYTCSIGYTYTTEAKSGKKRVAIRRAAVEMYNLIRGKYNLGTLAVSTYED